MAEGQIDQCRDLLCQLPQRRQEQRQAAELIHKERARRRQIFSRLAHTGKNHAVSAAYVHFRQRCQKLMLTFRRQRVNTGKVKGGVRPCQGRVVVLQQKGPALIAEKAAVDEDQRVVSQASPHIQQVDDGLLPGAVFPRDHNRRLAAADAVNVRVQCTTGGSGEAEDVFGKGCLRLRPCGKADAGLTGRERRLSDREEKGGTGEIAGTLPAGTG